MKYMIKTLGLVLLIAVSSCSNDEKVVFKNGDTATEDTGSGDTQSAKNIVLDMAAGFNLGNVFDNGVNPTTFDAVKPIIDKYYDAGMKNIRIPTTWMDRFDDKIADANGNINVSHPRFLELVKVIDYAISLDMYVVLNAHHEHWLKDNYDGTDTYNTKFTTLWTGIANHFKDYSHKLIFEVLNEPDGNMGENDGSGPFPDPADATAIALTRQINLVGYDAIRATGGNNTNRIIMVSVNGAGNANNFSTVYPNKASLPGAGNDKYLAIQLHSYNPWAFCGETGSNAAFPGYAFFETGIQTVRIHSVTLDVPVNYGEFGMGRSSNTAERNTDLARQYYRTMSEALLGQSMSYCVWDDRGWFGLINNSGTTFTNNIVPYMLQ